MMCRLLAMTALLALGGAPRLTAAPPNVVLVLADDFGYECVAANGGGYKTPHLDALAAGGVRFTHCHATPLCTPSRTQLLTGRYNCRNYVRFGAFDFRERTFAHALKAAGYATSIVGKWQLGGGLDGPREAGFDDYCLWQFDPATKGSRYADPKLFRNGRPVPDTAGKYGSDVFLDHAKGFVTANKGRPFFLYWPEVLTHAPFEPTPASAAWGGAGQRAKGRAARQDDAHFPDMVAYFDTTVGRLVAFLEKEGLRDNTLILVTGDNGTGKSITSTLDGRPVRGGKGTTTTLGTHVPLIASWPGRAKAGAVCGDLIDFTDLLPTLAEAAGAKLPAGVTLDGRSFLPQVRGAAGSPRDAIFCHYEPRIGNNTTKVRYAQDRRWKLYQDGRLFDLAADEAERASLPAGKEAAARAKLQAVLDRMERDVPFKK